MNTDTDKICIGTAEHPFKGTYDGNKKTIGGLIVTHDNMAATGLFGVVEGATLTDIRIQDVKQKWRSGRPLWNFTWLCKYYQCTVRRPESCRQ